MAKKKTKSSFLRIISVLAGVLGAGWLFSTGWQGVFDFIGNYSLKKNFFNYFFNTGLFAVATLSVAVLFFIVSLRDLEPLKNGFAVFTAIISAVAFVAYIVFLVNQFDTLKMLVEPGMFIHYGCALLAAVYVLFALYVKNGGTIRNAAWVMGVIALALILFGALYGYVKEIYGPAALIKYIFTCLSHLGIFYCGLRQY